MGLIQTLIKPDHDENEERAEVANAANLLQVGEFQFLQLAFHDWHKRDMPEAVIDRLFANYMMYNEVPFWARQYARKILDLEASGELDDNEPFYHRYDVDYHTEVPNGTKKFIWAVFIVMFAIFGGILIADMATQEGGGSPFPPYFKKGGPNPNP